MVKNTPSRKDGGAGVAVAAILEDNYASASLQPGAVAVFPPWSGSRRQDGEGEEGHGEGSGRFSSLDDAASINDCRGAVGNDDAIEESPSTFQDSATTVLSAAVSAHVVDEEAELHRIEFARREGLEA